MHEIAAEFMRRRERLHNDPTSDRPAIAPTQESIDRVHNMVMDQRILTAKHIGNAISVSSERVENILYNEFSMIKVSDQWLPRLLTSDQRCTRPIILFQADQAGFLEPWISVGFHFEPEAVLEVETAL